ncbi:MAG: hypothetical protein RIQ89_2198 [Bacteroidota bacterium]|jgi:2-C-methyl-D-erythritol 2,4-cyclodiphosphate synthase
MRIGFGFDVHPLVDGIPLWLGGINIPHDQGAKGHSDADVMLHAVCDAMLGALALGDIGKHFPDTDEKYKSIDSKILLSHVYQLIQQKGYKLGNMDIALVLEAPKIMHHVPQMQACIARILECAIDQVSIKATTNEKMGYVGRKEGICCYAVVLLLAQ